MIYNHVLNRGVRGVRSPAERDPRVAGVAPLIWICGPSLAVYPDRQPEPSGRKPWQESPLGEAPARRTGDKLPAGRGVSGYTGQSTSSRPHTHFTTAINPQKEHYGQVPDLFSQRSNGCAR